MAFSLEVIHRSAEDPAVTAERLHPFIREIRELLGYKDGEPTFGQRLGLYHPITGKISILGDSGWQLYDAVRAGDFVPDKSNQPLLEKLKSCSIVLEPGQTITTELKEAPGKSLNVYLEITEACNLKCVGCVVGAELYLPGAAQTISQANLNALLTQIFESAASHNQNSIKIKWAGGEPLLPKSFRLIETAQTHLSQLQARFPSIKLKQIILTNGTFLSEPVVNQLAQWNCDVGVSLWGIGSNNDRMRGASREKDKYDHIVEGLERLHAYKVSFSVNHVFTPDNAQFASDFIRAVWDPQSENYIGKNWQWQDDQPQPIQTGFSIYRAQNPEQTKLVEERGGYAAIVQGIRASFDVMLDLIKAGVPIPPLEKLDYLEPFRLKPAPCGVGFGYMAAGPSGVSACHEGLFNTSLPITSSQDFTETATSEFTGQTEKLLGPNIVFDAVISQAMIAALANHGGAGCPRTARMEHDGELGYAASTAEGVYAQILDEMIAVETMRRLSRLQT